MACLTLVILLSILCILPWHEESPNRRESSSTINKSLLSNIEEPERHHTRTAQLIDWSPEDNKSDSGTIAVDSLYQQLNALPKDDQEELMTHMGA